MASTISGDSGLVAPTGAVYNGIQSKTAVSASGTSVDFTDIPSWVKRITVMFSGVSTSGTNAIWIRLGSSGGFATSGYNGTVSDPGGTASVNFSSSFILTNSNAANYVWNGAVTFSLISSSIWSMTNVLGRSDNVGARYGAGIVDIGATLTQLRVMTASTDTFDAGTINILYE